MRTRLAACVVVAFSLGTLVAQQRDATPKPQTGTSRLAGRVVVNEPSGPPIRRAILLLGGGDLVFPRQTTTDDQGAFSFAQLPAGQYTLTAWRSGFVRDIYGNKRPGIGTGSTIAIGAGQRADITMRMTRSAAITGTILPTNGVPLLGLSVQALQLAVVNGERRLNPSRTGGVSPAGGNGGVVDDRGVFRLYGLAPGEYVIGTTQYSMSTLRRLTPAELQWATEVFQRPGTPPPPAPPSKPVTYAPVYFPGTTNAADAATITVGAGDERTGVDFGLVLSPVAKVEGTIVTPDGQPPQSPQASMVTTGPLALVRTNVNVRIAADGKFTADNVLPGHYTIVVRARIPGAGPAPSGRGAAVNAPSFFATAEIDIDGRDLSDVVIQLQPASSIAGRVVLEGTPVMQMSDAAVMVLPVSSPGALEIYRTPSVSPSPDGTFTLGGVPPGQYRLAAEAHDPGARWVAKSAMLGGRDVLDEMIDVRSGQNLQNVVVTLTDRAAQISGRLLDAADQPTSEYFIVVFPTDRRLWTPGWRRVMQARPINTGAFTIAGLPPGEYYMCALTDVDRDMLSDPTFLESLVSASRTLTLTEGEKKTQDFKVGR